MLFFAFYQSYLLIINFFFWYGSLSLSDLKIDFFGNDDDTNFLIDGISPLDAFLA